MTDALYQEFILDHNRKPKNFRGVRFLLITALSVACTEPASHDIRQEMRREDARLSRTYDLSRCGLFSSTRGTPCPANSTGSTQETIDSGRVSLAADGSAKWMIARRIRVNSCYLNGTDCATYDTTVLVATGTYTFTDTSLSLRIANKPAMELFIGLKPALPYGGQAVPPLVPVTWAGPDSLILKFQAQTWMGYVAIFKPE